MSTKHLITTFAILSISTSAIAQTADFPKAEIELPSIGSAKSNYPSVQKLDQMITDAAWLKTAHDFVYQEIQSLEESTDASMSGTPEEIMIDVMSMVNAVVHFDTYIKPIGLKAQANFAKKYTEDYAFGEAYVNTYRVAEKELSAQPDVYTRFRNGYQPSLSTKYGAMSDLITRGTELKNKVIEKVINQANVDMMVADYKKGKALTETINGTLNRLELVKTLDSKNEYLKKSIADVKQKKTSRIAEIKKALVEFRFPKPFDGSSKPSNANALEGKMRTFLSAYNYTSTEKYDVKKVKIAGPWIDVHNEITGKHIYSQIDFYVAVPSANDSEVLDVLLVTGKTDGPNHDTFKKYSVGGIGEMLLSNL